MEPIPTFWCEPTGFAVLSLRRFTFGSYHRKDGDPIPEGDDDAMHDPCPSMPVDESGYQQGHDASVVVYERWPIEWDDGQGKGAESWIDPRRFSDSPSWPAACDQCGEPFTDEVRTSLTHSQVRQDPIYLCPDVFEGTRGDMPPGAMWDATWLHGTDWVGADGISLNVKLPPGGPADEWCADCPSSDGRPWTREGGPRAGTVTAQPSIATPRWHGFLVAGELREV